MVLGCSAAVVHWHACCRTVGISIVCCMAGVILITQPPILGFEESERSLLGVMFALLQASEPVLILVFASTVDACVCMHV